MELEREIIDGLERMRQQDDEVMDAGTMLMKVDNGAMYPLDLLAFGVLKRHLSTSTALRLLIEAKNIVSARALLRLQIDTAVRFSAAWLVDRPHEFASEVLHGKRINEFRDRYGRRLTDRCLVETHKDEMPWLPTVYGQLSGYVHLSSAHIIASMKAGDEIEDCAHIEISPTDEMPKSSWLELIGCFEELTQFLIRLIDAYNELKRRNPTPINPEVVLEESSQAPH